MIDRRTPRALAVVLALGLAATACGGGDTGDTDPAATGTTGDATASPTATDPATEPLADSVTLLTHDSFNVSEGILDGFEQDTGITVEILRGGDAGQVVNQAILSKGEPQADVLFGIDNTFLTRALDEGLFVPYESPRLDQVKDGLVLDPEHRVTPIDYGDVCLNYDRSFFEGSDVAVPETLEQLTDPAYEGLLVAENPATSSPGLAFLLATIQTFGEDGWQDYWRQLRENDVRITDGWEDAYYGVFSGGSGEGDRPLVVSYASSPPAEVFFAEEPPEQSPTGAIVGSCFRQVEFAGILAGTEKVAAAQRLIDFMLSQPFQEDIPLQMFVFPAVEDVTLPDVFLEHAAVPEDPIQMDPQRIGEHREEWIEEWTRIVLR